MLLKGVCSTDVVCCGVQTTGLEAARLMRQRHVGDVVVVDDPHEQRVPVVGSGGSTVGIVTLDDLLRLLVAEAGELLETMAKAERHEQHARR